MFSMNVRCLRDPSGLTIHPSLMLGLIENRPSQKQWWLNSASVPDETYLSKRVPSNSSPWCPFIAWAWIPYNIITDWWFQSLRESWVIVTLDCWSKYLDKKQFMFQTSSKPPTRSLTYWCPTLSNMWPLWLFKVHFLHMFCACFPCAVESAGLELHWKTDGVTMSDRRVSEGSFSGTFFDKLETWILNLASVSEERSFLLRYRSTKHGYRPLAANLVVHVLLKSPQHRFYTSDWEWKYQSTSTATQLLQKLLQQTLA